MECADVLPFLFLPFLWGECRRESDTLSQLPLHPLESMPPAMSNQEPAAKRPRTADDTGVPEETLSFEEVKHMAIDGKRLVRFPTDAERTAFEEAMGEGGKGWIRFPGMLLPNVRKALLTEYHAMFDVVCPNWREVGFNGSHACSIIKPYGIPTCGWAGWIVRLAYTQFFKLLTEDDRPYVVSLDAVAFGLLSDETKTSTTTPHIDMSYGSPSARLDGDRKMRGIPFPCVQAQVNLFQHKDGTQLWFGKQVPTQKLPVNKGKDYTKVNELVTEMAPITSGDVVMWRSNVVHCTRKSGAPYGKGSGISRIGQFVCAYPKVFRFEKARRDKLDRFLSGQATGHLPTQCIKDGGRGHMSNSKARPDTYCTPLPPPTDPELIAFAAKLI